MADVMPDVATNLLRLEHQRLSLEATILDERAQLADLADERAEREERIAEAEEVIPEPLGKDATAGDRLRREHKIKVAERDILDVRIRLSEMANTERRLTGNISASEASLEDLDAEIEAVKEGQNG